MVQPDACSEPSPRRSRDAVAAVLGRLHPVDRCRLTRGLGGSRADDVDDRGGHHGAHHIHPVHHVHFRHVGGSAGVGRRPRTDRSVVGVAVRSRGPAARTGRRDDPFPTADVRDQRHPRGDRQRRAARFAARGRAGGAMSRDHRSWTEEPGRAGRPTRHDVHGRHVLDVRDADGAGTDRQPGPGSNASEPSTAFS